MNPMLAKLKKKSDVDLVEIYHTLCSHYGYIPLKEFEEMPSTVMAELLQKIIRDIEKQSQSMKKGGRK